MGTSSEVTPQSILEKFEFYFLGLTFTLLGASIQTASFTGHSHISVLAELIGWISFGLSGLVGLSKLEYLSVVIYLRNRKNEYERYKSILEEGNASGNAVVRDAETGEAMSIDAVIKQVGRDVKRYSEGLEDAGNLHGVKHRIQQWSFVFGLLFTAIARAYDAVASITCG
jgi:hypothetical protein